MTEIINKKQKKRSENPDRKIKASEAFNIDTDMEVPYFDEKDDYG